MEATGSATVQGKEGPPSGSRSPPIKRKAPIGPCLPPHLAGKLTEATRGESEEAPQEEAKVEQTILSHKRVKNHEKWVRGKQPATPSSSSATLSSSSLSASSSSSSSSEHHLSYNKLHPRNPYFGNPPDFKSLGEEFEQVQNHLSPSRDGSFLLYNWKSPDALLALTTALLKRDFQLDFEMPLNHLCPPVPQRLNYLLWVDDLLLDVFPDTRGLVCVDM